MLKKIVLGTLALGLIAILTIGAVNRTNSKASEQSSVRRGQTTAVAASQGAQVEQRGGGGGQGRGWQETSPQTLPSQPQGRQGGGQGGRGQQLDSSQSDSGVQGKGGLGEGRGYGQEPVGTTQSWQLVPSTIVSVADDLLTVKTNSGELLRVEGQPLKYLLSQGYVPQVGRQVTLAGFEEDGEFKVGELTDHDINQSVQLRDQSGRPMWSGRGQRG